MPGEVAPGWYWVRMGKVWEIAFKTAWTWERAGSDDRHIADADWDEIDRREITRPT